MVSLTQRLAEHRPKLLLSVVSVSALALAAACSGAVPANETPTGNIPAATQSEGGFAVVITTSRYGQISARTSPGASCSAQALLPSGRTSTAQGLQGNQTANGSGVVNWSYGTASNTTRGTGTHTVTCRYQGQTRSTSGPFQVN